MALQCWTFDVLALHNIARKAKEIKKNEGQTNIPNCTYSKKALQKLSKKMRVKKKKRKKQQQNLVDFLSHSF